jgi:hypothetical protein
VAVDERGWGFSFADTFDDFAADFRELGIIKRD